MFINKISKRHWFTFFTIVLFEIISSFIFSIANNKALSISFAVFGSLLCLTLIHFYLQEPVTEYGLQFKKPHIQIIYALVLAFIIIFSTYYYKIAENGISFILKRASSNEVIEMFPVSFLISLLVNVTYEEILFRGFLISFFRKLSGSSLLGVIIPSLWFGLTHYSTVSNPVESWTRVISAFTLGLIYGYLRVKAPSKFTLFSLSIAHFLNDILALILTFCFYT